MKVDRNKISIKSLKEKSNTETQSPQENLQMVWELTKELYSLAGYKNVERRLQRHITKLIRRKS